MYLCYVDESGVPQIPGNTSHYILAGLSIPVERWRQCETQIDNIKRKYHLEHAEMHIAWMVRPYTEQKLIPDFEQLDYLTRRSETIKQRTIRTLAAEAKYRAKIKKDYSATDAYIHLTLDERKSFVAEIAQTIASWNFARLFAECIDKTHFDPVKATKTPDEQAFEQVISRFERYLQNINNGYGLFIHDNNQTVARKHTDMMRRFHQNGTFWTEIQRIVETPLFVDSQLTGMIQIADLCSYALRRYLENGDRWLFDSIFQRADKINQTVVGVRHFTRAGCACEICISHRRNL